MCNAALDATRADVAAALGDPGGASRVALAQSATEGLNTLVAGLEIPAGSLIGLRTSRLARWLMILALLAMCLGYVLPPLGLITTGGARTQPLPLAH